MCSAPTSPTQRWSRRGLQTLALTSSYSQTFLSTLRTLGPWCQPFSPTSTRRRFIISVPNIANWQTRLALLLGRFTYRDTGVLDRTHVRFFTRRSTIDFVDACGLHLRSLDYTPMLARAFLPLIKRRFVRTGPSSDVKCRRSRTRCPTVVLRVVYPLERKIVKIAPGLLRSKLWWLQLHASATAMRTAIIGAGASGLSLALALDGEVISLRPWMIPVATAGQSSEGFTFDQGPHIMFSKDQPVLEFMIHTLGDNVHRSRRNNRICIDGSFIKYPIENDLAGLPTELRNRCLLDFLFNEQRELAQTSTILMSGSGVHSVKV